MPSLSTSRFNLKNAAFLDVVARFFAADLAGDFVQQQDSAADRHGTRPANQSDTVPPMVSAPLAKVGADGEPVYPTRHREAERHGRSGGADAQRAERRRPIRTAAMMLAGLPTNLLALLALPGRQGLGGEKGARAEHCRADGSTEARADPVIRADVAGFRKLLAEWPARIVMAGAELNEALPFPGGSARRDRRVGAESSGRGCVSRVQADAVRCALAGAGGGAVHGEPEDNYFALSEPGTITMLDNGRTRFTPSPGGRHHYLIVRPDQKERVLETYVKLITTQPPPPPARGRRGGAAALMIGAAHRREPDVRAARANQRPGRRVRHRRAPGAHADLRAVSRRAAACGRHERDRPDVLRNPSSQHRDVWEAILRRLRAGDMPPAGTRAAGRRAA